MATDVSADVPPAEAGVFPGTAGVSPAAQRIERLCDTTASRPWCTAAGETPAVPGKTPTTAILFALEREAAPFRRVARDLLHVSVHLSGIGRTRARHSAETILRGSLPNLIIAAGFCGALVPSLRIGDVVRSPRVITVDHLVTDPAEKHRLGQSHDAVDMESSAIAEVCAAKGVPFLAVRAVSDTVDTTLSPELVRLLSGGNVSVWRACGALVRKPSLLTEFLRLARDTKRAARSLADVLATITRAALPGPRSGGAD